MLQNEIVDILLRAGIPANTKGFTYIHDALNSWIKIPTIFLVKFVCYTQR